MSVRVLESVRSTFSSIAPDAALYEWRLTANW